MHWGGDGESTYASMGETLRGGLSLTSCGFGYWSHDIGGFEGTPDPAVFKRWLAFGLLSSHARLHGSSSVRVPWAFDEEAVDVARRFISLRLSLMPYLYRLAGEAHATGAPVMRSMFLEFPDDRGARDVDTQYMLGDVLLVAPVMDADDEADVYLPEGTWTSWWDGTTVTGPRWVGERHDAGTLPLYVRQGSVLPISSRLDRPESAWADGLALRCFALVDGEEREVVVPAHDGYDAVVFRVTRRGGALAARATGARGPWALEAKACAPRRRAPGPGRPSRSPSGSSETAARRRAGSPSASPSAGPCPARGLTPTRSSGTSPGGRRGRRARAPSRSGAAAPRADRRAARRRSR